MVCSSLLCSKVTEACALLPDCLSRDATSTARALRQDLAGGPSCAPWFSSAGAEGPPHPLPLLPFLEAAFLVSLLRFQHVEIFP